MSNDPSQDSINTFIGITSASPEDARFYIEAANGNVSAAVEQFFESQQSEAPETGSVAAQDRSGPRIATLGSHDSDASRKEAAENQYFAGGSRSSGQMIQGPPGSDADEVMRTQELRAEIMRKAAEDLPNLVYESDLDQSLHAPASTALHASGTPTSQLQASSHPFTGAAYRLGSEEEPGGMVTPSSSGDVGHKEGGKGADRNDGEGQVKVKRTLTFWRNGFSIDDGALQRYDDPQARNILEAIRSGRAPMSVLKVADGQPIDLIIMDKKSEEYKPPPVKAFSGKGQRLGSVVPEVIKAPPVGGASASGSDGGGAALGEPRVDKNKPTTRLLVRLTSGQRLILDLNHDHTVSDVRQAINARSSAGASGNYVLQMTHPFKVLQDERISVKEAGLLNGTVLQKQV